MSIVGYYLYVIRVLLNTQENKLLEDIILKYGSIVTFSQIFKLLKENRSRGYTKRLVSEMAKKGWLIRIKKGVYSVSDLFNRGNLTISQYAVANTIEKDSYVSFGFALQYYGMYDQLLSTITSVSLKQHKTTQVTDFRYRYVKTKEKYFFGWQEVNIDGISVKIAYAEKALVDMIQYSRTTVSVDMVIEKLQNFKDQIDFKRLNKFLKKSSKNTEKIFGFIFDLLKIDSSEIFEDCKSNTATTYIDKDSDVYNAKWNLYYNKIFKKYL